MNIAFRLDSGPSVGSGHLIRCTALAQSLALQKQNIIFICRNRIAVLLAFPTIYLSKTYGMEQSNGYAFPPIDDETGEMQKIIEQYQIHCLVVDHYGATTNYYLKLKPYVKYMVAIDDLAKVRLPVDMVVNGNAYANEHDYETVPVRLCGTSYTLLRDSFRNIPSKIISDDIRDIYITSGGADPLSLCKKVLSFIYLSCTAKAQIHVIIGPDFSEEYQNQLIRIINLNSNIHMVYKADMRNCMELADLFISAAGSTLYELTACGVPNICVVLSEDQIKLAESLHALGATCCIGDIKQMNQITLLEAIDNFKSPDVRLRLSNVQQKLVDGYGCDRVADHILTQMNILG